jgi:DNA-binding SARP family transcriptional activator
VAATDFRILGPLEVVEGGQPVRLAGSRQRALLAILLLHVGEAVSSDRLIEELWGDDPPQTGSAALRVRVSQLRRALGPAGDLLVTRPPGYALALAPEQLDLRRFERLVEAGGRALEHDDPATAVGHVGEALALWRGPPLADFSYAPFARGAIRRLEELRLAAIELRVEAQLALGDHARLAGELQALALEHPLRERLWAQTRRPCRRYRGVPRSGNSPTGFRWWEQARWPDPPGGRAQHTPGHTPGTVADRSSTRVSFA